MIVLPIHKKILMFSNCFITLTRVVYPKFIVLHRTLYPDSTFYEVLSLTPGPEPTPDPDPVSDLAR
jgi:hypothetical protein